MAAPNAPKKGRRNDTPGGSAPAPKTSVSHYPIDDLTVYCVRDESLPRADQEYQEEAFNMMNESGVDPIWMSAEDCLHCDADLNYFVMPVFKGPAFERLEQTKAKILSTAVIRQCMNDGRPIPKWDHPVLSLNMEGVRLCFTGLTHPRREELAKQVHWMCGVASPGFYTGITHLVTEKCVPDADKYRVSRNHKIPVLMPSWIEDAFEAAEKRIFCPVADPETIDRYRTPLFKDLVIVTTGIGGQERTDVMRLIELHGGSWSGEMKRGHCTHLISETGTGAKCRKAREWGSIKTVTLRWLRKSVELGYLQEEKRFDPDSGPAAITSTQNITKAEPPDLDVSSIYAPLRNQTLNSQWGRPLDGTIRRSAEKIPPVAPSPLMPRVHSRRRLSPGEEIKNSALDKLLDTTLRGDFDFFEGWTVFVCGLARSQQEKINRILDRCGATRVNSVAQATHVVVVNAGDQKSTLKDLQRSGNVEVVRAEWLVDCVEKKEMLCTEGYTWDPEATTLLSHSVSVVEDSYVTKTSKSRVSTASASSSTSRGVNLSSEVEVFNANHQASVTTSDIFANHTFRLHLLESDVTIQLEPLIESAGGRIIFDDQDDIADFMVSNPIELGPVPSPSDYRFTHLVTEFFVKYCLEKKKVFGAKERPLFRPIPAVSGSSVFKGNVIGLMGFEDLEKTLLKQLVQRFGGIVEGRIVSRERDGTKPCSHLVLGQETTKLDDCRKKIPSLKIVDASWIIECIINDSRLIETRFAFKEVPYKNYERTDDMWEDPPTQAANDREITEITLDVNMEEDEIVLDEDEPMQEVENVPEETTDDVTFGGNPNFAGCATSTPIRSTANPAVNRSIPRVRRISTDPTRFNPRFVLDGMTQIVDNIPSPNESVLSNDSMNISGIRKMLSAAAIRTAQPQQVILPQRSTTEPTPTKSNRRNSTVVTNATTPPPVVVEVRAPTVKAPPAVNTEIVEKTSHLMAKQMAIIRERKRREEEEEALKTQQAEANTRRKRPHELVEDSPAPPVKRNSQEETVIGWKCDRSMFAEEERAPSPVPSSSRRSERSERSSDRRQGSSDRRQGSSDRRQGSSNRRQGTIELSSHSIDDVRVAPVDDTDDFISIAGPSVVRRSSRLSGEPPSTPGMSPISQRAVSPIAQPAVSPIAQPAVSPVPRFMRDRMIGKRPRISDPPVPQKVFLFTGITAIGDKEQLIEAVSKLGGRINSSDKQEIPEEVTHLVCGKLVRGTKLMGCIASGRWVLAPEFLKESAIAGRWLPEEDFEWSAPSIIRSKNVQGRELQIANAAKRWRPAAREGRPAFWNWRVLLYAPIEKATTLAPLLEAGGAKVFVRDQRMTITKAEPTHVIMISSPFWNRDQLIEIAARGVHTYALDYVAHFLMDENVREEDYFHKDYKILRQRGY